METNEVVEKIKDETFLQINQEFIRDYKEINERYNSLASEVREISEFSYRGFKSFTDKIIPAMFANIAQKHEEIMTIETESSSGYKRKTIYVATPNGIRKKGTYQTKTDELEGKDIVTLFVDNRDRLLAWAKLNLTGRNLKKYQAFEEFGKHFISPKFKADWITRERYDDSKTNGKTFYVTLNKKVDYICGGDPDSVSNIDVCKVVVFVDTGSGKIHMSFVDKKCSGAQEEDIDVDYGRNSRNRDAVSYTTNSFYGMIGFRHLKKEVLQAISLGDKYVKEDNAEMMSWFNDMKEGLNKWIVLGNI